MTPLRVPFSLTALAASALLALATLAPAASFAQTEPAPPPDVTPSAPTTQQAGGDPPSRVARLDYLSGPVTTEPAGASDWSYAAVNRPLTSGDQLWNDQGARSELHIGSTAVRLDQSTALAILALDDRNTQLKVGLGSLSTHVRELPAGSAYEIDTPNLALAVDGAGDYRVDVAPDGTSTTVTVRRGSATAFGDNGQIPIAAGQQLSFTGTNLQLSANNAAPGPDPFDQWSASRDAAEDRSISARYVSREVPGYQDLDANGSWRDSPDYGAIWIPNDVPAGWAPYHTGHWIWQAPWGWTWVDDAPWGFAPYHYGRWAYVDDSWAWVPGPIVPAEPPCYAPALVAFVGGGGGGFDWSVGLAVGGAVAAGVAWFPLAPHEAWHPGWGGWSPRYYDRVNRTVIVNNTRITNITTIHNTYVNYHVRNAVTAVPAQAFVHGQPVARFAQHVDPRQWHDARIGAGAPGIAPVRQSFSGGLRNASYRPPQPALSHPIVATRNPAVPAAFHDRQAQQFAQHGGRVPGAGAPVVRSATPPNYAPRPTHLAGTSPGAPNQWAMRNVQLVNPRGPVLQPGRPVPAVSATAGGQRMPREEPGRMQEPGQRAVPGAPATPGAAAFAAHPGMVAPGNRVTGAMATGSGVPRPPAEIGREGVPGGRPGAGAQPAWTQPHAPIEQQRAAGQFRPNEAPGARENAQPHAATPGAPVFGGGRPAGQQTEPSRAPGFVPQPHAQSAQPRVEGPRAESAQPRIEARAEPHAPTPQPSFARQPERQPAAQLERPQPHFEAPQAPRVEAPRIERPQPHFEPQPPHFERPAAPQAAPHFERPAAPPPQQHVEAPRQAPVQHASPAQGRQEPRH
ncbi:MULTISPECIES: DUF6600 domain-containing protein [Burkholderia]|uniref:DUF6600 domain-containing protein n=1 Tax=Burkholderia TaxID=32008 RepID=UPI00136FA4B5|nr:MULTISPECIES: DUF6600 domain-containing protein [Burkholderia]NBI48534.1 FecR protein [Burkholderia sp. ISTR5]